MLYKNWFELKSMPKYVTFEKYSKIFIAWEIMHKSRQYQISRYLIVYYSKFLKSDTWLCFAYISAPDEAMDPTFQMEYVSAI